jgi:ubiquitin-conjugating enzyme E2 S
MTSIHAPIPPNLRDAVLEAKRRGEEHGSGPQYEAPQRPAPSLVSSIATSVVMKNQAMSSAQEAGRECENSASLGAPSIVDLPEDDEEDDDAKENDPSHSPSPALLSHENSRRNVLGKRPLLELPTPIDPDAIDSNTTGADEKTPHGQLPTAGNDSSSEPVKKSPKLDISARNLKACGKLRQEERPSSTKDGYFMTSPTTDFGDDKENIEIVQRRTSLDATKAMTQQPAPQTSEHLPRPTLRKVSNVGSSRSRGQARVGIRRL